MTRELSIIIPTLSEKEKIGPLIEALDRTLQGISWEVIIVDDDSPDGTAEAVLQPAFLARPGPEQGRSWRTGARYREDSIHRHSIVMGRGKEQSPDG